MIYLDESVAVRDPAFGVVMCEASGDNVFGYHSSFVTSAGNNCYYAVSRRADSSWAVSQRKER